MAYTLTALSQLFDTGFDTVIDVRSPSEWADDHLPGAINLPVLDDAQRARVGTIYKQESPFKARKVGGALVAEIIFSYPGLGYTLLTAIQGQDYPLISAVTLIITIMVLIANFTLEIVYGFIDPRIKAAQAD